MDDIDVTSKGICDLLGIAPQTIRFYEGYGFDARYKQEAQNRYRHYRIEDIAQLSWLRELTQMGLTVRDASHLLRGADAAGYHEPIERAYEALEEELRNKRLLLEAMREREKELGRLAAETGIYRDALSPDMWMLPCTDGLAMPADPDTRRAIREWAARMPPVSFSFYIPAERLVPGAITDIAMTVPARYADDLGKNALERAVHLPSRQCVTWVLDVDATASKSWRRENPDFDGHYPLYADALAYLEERGLHLTGYVVGQLIASCVHDGAGVSHDYYRVWFPVEGA